MKRFTGNRRHLRARTLLSVVQGCAVLILSGGGQVMIQSSTGPTSTGRSGTVTASDFAARGVVHPASEDGVAPAVAAPSGESGVDGGDSGVVPAAAVDHTSIAALHETTSTSAALAGVRRPSPVPSSGAHRVPINQLKVMNYYPAHNGWSDMWVYWDAATLDSDFGRIAALRANTVRIIVDTQTWSFGWPSPNPVMQQRLAATVSLAAKHGLGVQLTLFDVPFADYSNFSSSESWANQVLAPFHGDQRISVVELRNEIDPNVAVQMSWVKHMLPYLKSIDGGIPVTVSVCGCDNAGDLAQLKNGIAPVVPDFWDFHFYADAALAFGTFRDAKAYAAPQPLLVGETGYRTDVNNTDVAGIPWTQSAQEAYQNQFYRTVANAARQAGIPPVGPWMLYDIADPKCAVCTQTFGIFRADGSAKPAVSAVLAMFAGTSESNDLNNSFERGSGGYPDIWRLYGWGYGTFAQDSSVAHSGSASARISASTSVATGGSPAFYSIPVDGAQAGRTYTVSAWVRGAAASGSTLVGVYFYDAHSGWLGGATSAPLPAGDSGWTLLTASATAPAGTAFRQLVLASGNNTGTAWFDDVSFS
ncbi:MAG TPA: hypothetical protein VG266_10380 [Candidatus Dormibacteraeota bacterium]|nr:hypothetical protein [Candidatus Dormibacteraeota bacterium]